MQLTIREAASYLNLPEAKVRRLISTRGLPVHRVNERLLCNAIELWEWAVENGIPVSASLLQHARAAPEEVPDLVSLIGVGGIHRDVGGKTRPEVLREIVRLLPVPDDVDRDFLATVLEAREAMGSTGIGDGIAIPHVRNPILLHVDQPFVSLCLLRDPVAFDAVDGKPVSVLFVLVSSNIPEHLKILAQLGFVLRDPELRRLLSRAAPNALILERMATLDAGRHGLGRAAGGEGTGRG